MAAPSHGCEELGPEWVRVFSPDRRAWLELRARVSPIPPLEEAEQPRWVAPVESAEGYGRGPCWSSG